MNDYGEWIPLNQREKLSIPHILAIAVGNFAPGLIWNIFNALFNPFVQELRIDEWTKRFILLAGSIIGLIFGIIIGAVSDHITFKYGRRRIFIVAGLFITVFSLLCMAFYSQIANLIIQDENKIDNCKKIIFISSEILMFFGNNLVQGPSRALCSDVTPHSQQNFMAGCCQLFCGVSPIISNIIGSFEFNIANLSHDTLLIIVSAIFAFITLTIQFFAAREEPLRENPNRTNPFKKTFIAFKKMPHSFSRAIPAFFFSNIAMYQFMISFTSFMGHDIKKGSMKMPDGSSEKLLFNKGKMRAMQCSIINNFVQLIYGFLNHRAVDTIGMKWLMVIGNSIMTIALLCFLFITNEYVYFGIAGLMGLGQVISMTIPHGIVSLVIPTQELAHNFGILHCFLIFGQIVSNLGIDTIVSKIVNNDDANISTYDIGYSSIFGFLSVIASFFIVQPSLADIGNYNKIGDNSGTSGTSGTDGFSLDE